MGASNLTLHTKEHKDIAAVAKVLAHPARVAIIEYISSQDACICGEIVDKIGLSQPTISQHLQVIRGAGLIKGTFEGKSICYCIDIDRFKELQLKFAHFFNTTAANCC